MCHWRRTNRISWTYRVKNEVLQRVEEERNILRRTNTRKDPWIGHTLRMNCLLKRVTVGRKRE
jgi:hypothetical protein